MPRMSIGSFAKVIGKPLYKYQIEIGNAIVDSVLEGKGLTFSVLLARQMGKNQISAMVECYILACMEGGTIVKCAPTFKPQVLNSCVRLLGILDNPVTRTRVWKSHGYIIGVAKRPEDRKAQAGPYAMFFSAGPDANIMGATASLLLEIDEAQGVSVEKYNRDLRPMASTQNATTVLYGTAWTDDTLLAMVKANNQQLEESDGIRRHFEHDWRTLAAINHNYKAFVEKEIQRLGKEHPTIRTQYRLLPISGAGYLLNDLQRRLLQGQHQWQDESDEDSDGYYVAGMDVGGEERVVGAGPAKNVGAGTAQGMGTAQVTGSARGTIPTGRRDSTVLTIGRVLYNKLSLPVFEVVHQYWFTGVVYADQYAIVSEIIQRWNIRKIVIDATGLGEALASLLMDRFADGRIVAFKFSRSSKSRLTYQLLSVINSGRLRLYSRDGAPEGVYDECWKQIRLARYRVPGENLLDMYVPSEEGHDDFLISLALCCEGTQDWSMPVVDAGVVRPRRFYQGEGWY